MSRAIFIASSHSAYDDRPGERYHFPNSYLSRVAKTVGDWIIYYQGRRGGVTGYYAVQRVERIVPDPVDPTHSYALMDRGSYLEFDRQVQRFRDNGRPYETGLPLSRGSNTSAVRVISDQDFAAIISEGLRGEFTNPDTLPRHGPLPTTDAYPNGLFDGEQSSYIAPGAERAQILVSRAFRDQAFARQVKTAYAGRCSMTGLALRNGGGRPEVEAAHIIPVEARGPDCVSNGLALSGTVHWMFDRGLVSVDADMRLLVARDEATSVIADRLFLPDRRLLLPDDPRKHPHPAYLKWHRENRFKG